MASKRGSHAHIRPMVGRDTPPPMASSVTTARLILGDCLEVLAALPPASVDAIVTDPPYGLSPDGRARTWDDIEGGRQGGGFMGQAWDAAVPGVTWARACHRVLKPGGHLVAFSATRTIHRLASALEDGNFQIRDQLAHLQWQGFPKSHNVANDIDKRMGQPARGRAIPVASTHLPSGRYKEERLTSHAVEPYKARTPEGEKWSAFGTALKPAFEPAVLARKPPDGTIAANVLQHGTGALNIDACRIGYGDPAWPGPQGGWNDRVSEAASGGVIFDRPGMSSEHDLGRWPANIYATPKASRGEREEGCERLTGRRGFEAVARVEGSAGLDNPRAGAGRTAETVKNFHPTVKPLTLMRWISRLVGCQRGSVILDPFMGSGTTGAAALLEGFAFIGIECEPEYMSIAEARIRHHAGALFAHRVTVEGGEGAA